MIDWEQPANNDFLLASQFSVTGALYTCRPDLVGFVNGLPLVVIELKKPGVPARAAFYENLTHYKARIPQLFWFNALLIASNGTDITGVMGDIAKLLDASITGVDMPAKPAPVMDLSKIDFEALRSRFKESKTKNTDLEVLKATIWAMLERLIQLNKTRANFAEKFEELIESYNAGSRNIEELFEELLKLSRNLTEEQQRHVRENMTEEEWVIFDVLTRPAPELSPEERIEVKKVARELLNRLKSLLVLNWRQKSSARSQVCLAIEDLLDEGLPRIYSPDLFHQKCSAVFEHFYEDYPEREVSVYANAV